MFIRAVTLTLCTVLWTGAAFAIDVPASETVPDAADINPTDPTVLLPLPSDTKVETNPADEGTKEYNMVVLQGLNKVTGHVSKFEGPLGTVMNFGTLEIIARRCWKASPEERPENAALLEIREVKAEEGAQKIFLGWMFSSSPGLSGLEHPVYDVTVLSCEAVADPEKNEAATPTKTADSDKKAATSTKKKHTK
jgi:hypothetical protein